LSAKDIFVISGDIASDHSRRRIVEQTLAHYGRIDVLVNSAGIGLYGLPSSVPLDLTIRLFEINVFAPLAMAQLVIPEMRRLGSGTIVNLGSVGGYVSLPWASAYSASKFALHALNDALRRELRRDRIHVMNISPGIVDTAFRTNVLGGAAPPRVAGIRRTVSPDAVAQGILDGIKDRRRTVYLPRIGRLFRLIEILSPRVMDWYTERFLIDYPGEKSRTSKTSWPAISADEA
jgi:short-subunit dehydrogenase